MKKMIFRACLCMAILCTGVAVSSCDENSTWLNFIKNLIGTNTTYTYQGNASYQCLAEPNSEGAYTKTVANFTAQNSQVQLTTTSANETLATLVLPAASTSGVSISAITLSNLAMTSTTSATTLTVGDDAYIDGTITANGQTLEASNLYITSASATSGVITLEMTIYFGDNAQAVNYKYSGQVVQQ